MVLGQPGQKVHKISSAWMYGFNIMCLSSQLCGEAQIGDHGPGHPISKITNAKRAGRVA
jgi:hypothetical protein